MAIQFSTSKCDKFKWIKIESPTIDTDSVNRMADHIEMELGTIGLDVEREHGLNIEYTDRTGGGSDGNLAAAEGVPILDGLGADGHGAHQLDEHIYISSLEPRIRTWMKIFERLD